MDLTEAEELLVSAMPPESQDELREKLIEEKSRNEQAMLRFVAEIEDEKDKAVRWRRPTERRWLDDLRQIHGETPDLTPVKDGAAVPYGRQQTDEPDYRKTLDNITRPAVVQIGARLGDMLFPTNEKNWDMEPSPFPELSNPDDAVIDPLTGQPRTVNTPEGPRPQTMGELAEAIRSAADRKCSRMKQHIDDALSECQYASHGRQAIDDACSVGSGVIKGPIVKRTKRSSYGSIRAPDGQLVPLVKTHTVDKPAATWVDIWNFYPQPCRDLKDAEHTFELHLLTKKKLRKLAQQPGFDAEAINRLLNMDADLGSLGENGAFVERERIISQKIETIEGRYAVWERNGPVPKVVLRMLGIDIDDEDELTEINGCVWFCQGVVIKAAISLDEEYDEHPYRMFCYENDPTCCFGFSVPYVMRHDQGAVNQTWHMLMLNGMMSSGPQIGVIPGMMEPTNGEIKLTCLGPKVWTMKDEVTDIRQVLSVAELPNYTQQLMPLYEAARRNAADHTMLPSFFEGKASEVTQTASGLAMLLTSSNIVQRRAAKAWDDHITIPLISAFSRYFLMHGDDESRGDFDVVPKGESYLLIKDIQAQQIQILIQLTENPRFAPYFKEYDLLKLFVKTLNVTVTGLMREEAEVDQIRANEQQQPSPEMLQAQARAEQAEAAKQRAAADARKAELDHEYHMEESRRKALSDYAQMVIAQRQLDLAYAQAAMRGDLDMQSLAKDLQIEEGRRQIDEFRAAMEGRLAAHKIAADREKLQVQVQHESPLRVL